MKQIWVPKSTSVELKTKSFIGDKKKHWNKHSLGKKKRVLKPQVNCSSSNGFLSLVVKSDKMRESKCSNFIF